MLIDVCFSTFSSSIPRHLLCFFSSLYCIFLLVICVEGADVTFIYYGLLDLHRPGLEVRR